MRKRLHLPSPALAVALVALFVALGGTATAGVIVAHAKLADNATKLQGKTPVQVAALLPSLAGYVTVKTASWSLSAQSGNDFSAACDAGQKAIGGGYDNPDGNAIGLDARPSPDGGSWHVVIVDPADASPASGSVYAVCLR